MCANRWQQQQTHMGIGKHGFCSQNRVFMTNIHCNVNNAAAKSIWVLLKEKIQLIWQLHKVNMKSSTIYILTWPSQTQVSPTKTQYQWQNFSSIDSVFDKCTLRNETELLLLLSFCWHDRPTSSQPRGFPISWIWTDQSGSCTQALSAWD